MNLGILLWNTCNARCSHCAVNSGPAEKCVMTDEQIFELIDGTFYDCSQPSIGLSGGEAFVYFDRLCTIIQYATDKGALVSVNTNGFWGTTVDRAVEMVKRVKACGLVHMVVSIDEFHQEYVPVERVLNVVRACKRVHLEVEVQCVATKRSRRLADIFSEHGDTLLNITCREIPCHPVGRASVEIEEKDLFLNDTVPEGLCPSAILSISAYGKVIPCCNTAGHLPSLEIGTIEESLPELNEKFLRDPLMGMLRLKGPKALWEAAVEAGYVRPDGGYIDQCHLCHDLFKNTEVAEALREAAPKLLEEERYQTFLSQFVRNMQRLSSQEGGDCLSTSGRSLRPPVPLAVLN